MNKVLIDNHENFSDVIVRLPLLEAVSQDKVTLILDMLNSLSGRSKELTDKEKDLVKEVLHSTSISELAEWKRVEFRNVLNKAKMIVEFVYHESELFDKTFGLPKQFKSFYGRGDDYCKLVRSFEVKPKTKQIIVGIAGGGKTVFANHYVHKRLEEGYYQWAIWLTGSSKEEVVISHLSTQLNQLAFELGLNIIQLSEEKRYREIYKRLSSKGRGLVIFDNIPIFQDIQRFQPNDEYEEFCDVLITSRNTNIVGRTLTRIPLNMFDLEEAKGFAMLMLEAIGITEVEAELLAKTLGNCPLAMTQAFAYIEGNSTVSDFCQNYNRHHENRQYYLDQPVYPDDPYQQKTLEYNNKVTMLTVVNVTLEEIRKKNPEIYDEVLLILKALTYISPEIMIPRPLLSAWLPEDQGNLILDQVLNVLRKYSYLEECNERLSYRIHQIIQDVISVQDSSKDTIQKIIQWESMLKKVLKYSGGLSRLEKEKMYINLKSHVSILICHLEKSMDLGSDLGVSIEEIYDMLAQFNKLLGKSEKLQGEENQAEKAFEQELKCYQRSRSVNIERKMVCEMNIAAMKLHAGRFEAARPLLSEVAPFFKDKNNDKEGVLLLQQGNLALMSNDAQQAVTAFNKALSLFKLRKPPKFHKIGVALMNLGSAYQVLEKSEEAISYFNEALRILKGIFKDNHPSVARCMINIGHEYQKSNNIEKARESYTQAESILTGSLGENHADVGRCVMSLGLTYFSTSYNKSIELLDKAYNILKLSLENTHPEIGRYFLNKGLALFYIGRETEAENCFKGALNILLVLGEENPEVKLCRLYLKELYEKNDKRLLTSFKAYPIMTETYCFSRGNESTTWGKNWYKTQEILERYYEEERLRKESEANAVNETKQTDRVEETEEIDETENALVEYLTSEFGNSESIQFKEKTF